MEISNKFKKTALRTAFSYLERDPEENLPKQEENRTLPTEVEKSIGLLGQKHLRYLKEYRKIAYINLLTRNLL